MTYTTLQLDIIREFGRKNHTAWCYTIDEEGTMWYCATDRNWLIISSKDWGWWSSSDYWDYMGEILWAIPHLEDVFRVAEERWLVYELRNKYVKDEFKYFLYITDIHEFTTDAIPWKQCSTLIDQDESTLTQLLTLFKKW